jgi:Ca2+/Na+ antiporter
VLRFEYPFLVLASWITLLLSRDGWLDRLEGGFFLASMIGFTAYAVRVARREITDVERIAVAEAVPEQAGRLSRWPTWKLAMGIAGTLLGLPGSPGIPDRRFERSLLQPGEQRVVGSSQPCSGPTTTASRC